MTTVYLSTTGSDSNTYAQAQNPATPWATIAKCNTSATSGDTISVAAGVYTWLAQTFTKNFTIVGAGALTTIFDAGGVTANKAWSAWSTLSISGITFRNNGIPATGATGIFGAGAAITSAISFSNCIFKSLYPYDAEGTYSQGIFNNAGATASGGAVAQYTFNACLFCDFVSNGTGGYLFAAGGTAGGGGSRAAFTNCSLYIDSTGYTKLSALCQLAQAAHTASFTNCAFKVVVSTPVSVIGSGTHTASYSAFSGFTVVPTGTGVITSDPLFVDAPNGNFNLRPTSPCIDTGTIV